jgi:predicted CoA-binding protein
MSKAYNIIGFAGKYYTLWSVVSTEVKNEKEIYTQRTYAYLKNISMNIDKVKSLYPDVKIDKTLNGKRCYTTIENYTRIVDPKEFTFGKYLGKRIDEVADVEYTCWYSQQIISEENRNACYEFLKLHGYVVIEDRIYSPEEYEKIQSANRVCDELLETNAKQGYIDLTITDNAHYDAENFCVLPTNIKGVYIVCEEGAKAMYYQGWEYYLPIFNGKAKRMKNKTVRIQIKNTHVSCWRGLKTVYITPDNIKVL